MSGRLGVVRAIRTSLVGMCNGDGVFLGWSIEQGSESGCDLMFHMTEKVEFGNLGNWWFV
jgi:hypothetical protein